jgi:hypothetical protein
MQRKPQFDDLVILGGLTFSVATVVLLLAIDCARAAGVIQ